MIFLSYSSAKKFTILAFVPQAVPDIWFLWKHRAGFLWEYFHYYSPYFLDQWIPNLAGNDGLGTMWTETTTINLQAFLLSNWFHQTPSYTNRFVISDCHISLKNLWPIIFDKHFVWMFSCQELKIVSSFICFAHLMI